MEGNSEGEPMDELAEMVNSMELVSRYRRYLEIACAEDVAGDLLLTLLEGHDRPVREIYRLADHIGIPRSAIKRLKRVFEIDSYRKTLWLYRSRRLCPAWWSL
jgi:hypothetical protein